MTGQNVQYIARYDFWYRFIHTGTTGNHMILRENVYREVWIKTRSITASHEFHSFIQFSEHNSISLRTKKPILLFLYLSLYNILCSLYVAVRHWYCGPLLCCHYPRTSFILYSCLAYTDTVDNLSAALHLYRVQINSYCRLLFRFSSLVPFGRDSPWFVVVNGI